MLTRPGTEARAHSEGGAGGGGVFDGVTGSHWLVVFIASAGWLFDMMDARLFTLAREPALRDLLGSGTADATIKEFSGWATAMMMFGWATGGIVFGITSDRWGRVKTMAATLAIYAGFTGVCGLSRSGGDFLAYRFLAGLGMGGMFAAATTLVAESVPPRIRALALGSLQALSATGNIIGSLIATWIRPGEPDVLFGMTGWRVMFLVGVLPAGLVVPIVLILKEPKLWLEARRRAGETADKRGQVGSLADLFHEARWRRNALVGVSLGLVGMAGLWGIGYFSPELISSALKGEPQAVVDQVRGYGMALQDVGAFLGVMTFTFVAMFLGRRLAFLGSLILCLTTTIFVFNSLHTRGDAYWMLPMMGFAQLSLFGGYSIYFPELFPTRLRGTGVGFCYNTVRYLAAAFPPALMALNSFLSRQGIHEPFRKAATILSLIFVLGLVALIWAPETKGKPLPE